MKLKSLNIFSENIYSHQPRFWIKNIIQFFRNIYFAWQRATKGFCDADLYDLSDYYSLLFQQSLKSFADRTLGYPTSMTFEEWETKVREIAELFRQGCIDVEDNEATNRFVKLLMIEFPEQEKAETDYLCHLQKLREESNNEILRLTEQKEKALAKAFSELQKYYEHLWF